MSVSEKDAMRTHIMADYIADKSSGFKHRDPIKSVWNVYSFGHWIGTHRMATSVAVLLIVILGSKSLVSASQNALPGDALYSLKVNIAEPAKLALISDPVQKAEVKTELLQKRFEEVETLAIQGKLDPVVKQSTEQRVEKQVNDLNRNVSALAKVSTDKAEDVDSTLEASIRVHERVLSQIATRDLSSSKVSRAASNTTQPSFRQASSSSSSRSRSRNSKFSNNVATTSTSATSTIISPSIQSLKINSTDNISNVSDKQKDLDSDEENRFEQKVQKKEKELYEKAQQRIKRNGRNEEIRHNDSN